MHELTDIHNKHKINHVMKKSVNEGFNIIITDYIIIVHTKQDHLTNSENIPEKNPVISFNAFDELI